MLQAISNFFNSNAKVCRFATAAVVATLLNSGVRLAPTCAQRPANKLFSRPKNAVHLVCGPCSHRVSNRPLGVPGTSRKRSSTSGDPTEMRMLGVRFVVRYEGDASVCENRAERNCNPGVGGSRKLAFFRFPWLTTMASGNFDTNAARDEPYSVGSARNEVARGMRAETLSQRKRIGCALAERLPNAFAQKLLSAGKGRSARRFVCNVLTTVCDSPRTTQSESRIVTEPVQRTRSAIQSISNGLFFSGSHDPPELTPRAERELCRRCW